MRLVVSDMSAHDDEGDDALTSDGVGGPDDGCFGDRWVGDESRFDLSGRDAVPRHVHDIVDATEKPQITVLVLLRPVAGKVLACIPRQVGVLIALGVTPDYTQH